MRGRRIPVRPPPRLFGRGASPERAGHLSGKAIVAEGEVSVPRITDGVGHVRFERFAEQRAIRGLPRLRRVAKRKVERVRSQHGVRHACAWHA